MKKINIIIVALVFLNLIFNTFLLLNSNKETTLNYLFNASYGLIFFTGGIIGLTKKLYFLGSALIFYALGLFAWTYYNLILGIPAPYPGLPDLFFLFFQPLLILGYISLIKSYNGKFGLKTSIEVILIFVVFFVILASFLDFSVGILKLPTTELILGIAYPFFDSLLVALAIAGIRTEGGSVHPNLLIFAFAAFFMASADTVFAYRIAQDSYWNGGISDSLFLIAGTLFSAGIISIKEKVSQ